ncbi:MAG: LysR family transcriptional regulator [Pseudomonadota bacterium]|nr:LysR family transcriptional regulator [Pseudomonadota bacterium]
MDRITGVQLFIRIVETGSFSKASVDLGVTQPTATKHVAAVEARLGARLLNRNTRGVSTTEIGALYYEKCKTIQRELAEADSLAALLQSRVGGQLRVSTSVAFGRRVLTPLVLDFMREHPELSVDLSFDDRYVNLVEQGIDVAIRMGRLADSSLGARYLALNPWVLAAAPAYLASRSAPLTPADLADHPCLIYSTVQGDERWHFRNGEQQASVVVHGPLRTNNLSVLLEATRQGMGLAILPTYVAHEAVQDGTLVALLAEQVLPAQEMHAVYPSPKLVPGKVSSFIAYLQLRLQGSWWAQQR